MTLIYIIILFSIIANLLFWILDFQPMLNNKSFKHYMDISISDAEYKASIAKAGLKMIQKKNTYASIVIESPNIIVRLTALFKLNKFSKFAIYNYHRAYLFSGLASYFISMQDKESLLSIMEIFSKYMDKEGKPSFKLNKIDQATFGLTAIILYEHTGDIKYKTFSDKMYDYLLSQKNNNDIVLYRKGTDIQFVDTLGMICPFLMKYSISFNTSYASDLVFNNLLFYINNGLEREMHLPFHGINLKTKIKLGPANWGRGIGWYALALSYVKKYSNKKTNPNYDIFLNEHASVYTTLLASRSDNLWPQFIGQPSRVDLSASSLFLYSFSSIEVNSEKSFLDSLKIRTTTKGFIDFSSGETMDINKYSSIISFSELAQGMLLHYFSEKNRTI